jgi:hypothetical protein
MGRILTDFAWLYFAERSVKTIFFVAEARQPIEKSRFGRENPRKSKEKKVANPRKTDRVCAKIRKFQDNPNCAACFGRAPL